MLVCLAKVALSKVYALKIILDVYCADANVNSVSLDISKKRDSTEGIYGFVATKVVCCADITTRIGPKTVTLNIIMTTLIQLT